MLIASRRRDHPWLLGYFIIPTLLDTFAYVCASEKFGGLGLVPISVWNRGVYIFVFSCIWLSFFLLPMLFALKLRMGRVRALWVVPAVAALLLISASEWFGVSVFMRRVLMHRVFSPACLMIAIALPVHYMWTRSSAGMRIDYAAFAVLLTGVMLALRLVVWMDADFKIDSIGSRVYYIMTIVVLIVMKYVWPHIGSKRVT